MKFHHRKLDRLLGELEPGKIILLVGTAGTGKTSMALQLAKSVQHPYIIDTEGISLKRVKQMDATHVRIKRITNFNNQFHEVENFREENCDLLIIDSLVMLYRLQVAKTPNSANWKLAKQMANLVEFAEKQQIPIVVTGHVYEWENKLQIVSGDVVKYWAKTILLLEKGRWQGTRKATLLKHPWKKEGESVNFRICGRGIC